MSTISPHPTPTQRAHIHWMVIAELGCFVGGDPFRRVAMLTDCLLPVIGLWCPSLAVGSAEGRSSVQSKRKNPATRARFSIAFGELATWILNPTSY